MAPKPRLTEEQKTQVAAFLEHLYKLGNFKSWAEFGREAGGYSSEQMSDWSRGENVPTGYNLIQLIWAAERRVEGATVYASFMSDPLVAAVMKAQNESSIRRVIVGPPLDEGGEPQTLGSLLGALQAEVAERPTRAELQEGLDTLRAAIDRLASRDTTETLQPKKAKTGRR